MTTVLVTGTSTGIGLATALAFARAGHRVAATMRNPGRAPELAEAAAREKLAITVYPIDVDNDASVRDGVGRIAKELGQIDVLVNNAGIERTSPPSPGTSPPHRWPRTRRPNTHWSR